MPTERLISQVYIKLNGADASSDVMRDLLDVTVEEDQSLPAMFVIRLHDPELAWTDGRSFALGTEVAIAAAAPNGRQQPIAAGEVTALEPEFTSQGPTLTVRGYDRLHRLTRGRKTRAFANMGDADIAAAIAREAGLRAQTDSTSERYEHVLQHNQTDWEFLLERARRIGFIVFMDGRTLHFRKPQPGPQPVELEYGEHLVSLRLRQSAGGQVREVLVRGWDPKNKREIVGKAATPRGLPQIGESRNGGAVVREAFSAQPQQIVVERPVATQSEADALAQALLDSIAGAHVQLDGVAAGNPALRAGASVRLISVGTRFSGTYTLTSVTHRYSAAGYSTSFRASRHDQSLLALLRTAEAEQRRHSVVVGVVTSVDDPDQRGRVRVRFPWLDGNENSIQSAWARLVSPGAGNQRGICFMPEVDDEVLVAFEHGDMRAPYVLGGLWNGKDKLPDTPVENKKIARRVLKTRNGHQLTFTDTDGGKGAIRIETAGGRLIDLADTDQGIEIKTSSHTIKLDDSGRSLSLDTQGDLSITATGKVSIEGKAGVEVKSPAKVDLQAQGQLNLQATGPLDVKSSAILTVQGSLVKIN